MHWRCWLKNLIANIWVFDGCGKNLCFNSLLFFFPRILALSFFRRNIFGFSGIFLRSTVWHLVYFISVLSFILCVIFFSFAFFSFQNTNEMSNKTLNCPRSRKSMMPELRIQYALLQFPLHLRNEKNKIKTKTTAVPTMKKSWKKVKPFAIEIIIAMWT